MRSVTPTPSPRRCSDSAPRSASLASTGIPAAPIRSPRIWANGTSCQPRLGARRTSPSAARMMPGNADPDPDQGGTGIGVLDHQPHQVDDRVTDRDRVVPRRDGTGGARLHDAAEPDAGDGQAVDPQVDRQDVRTGPHQDVHRRTSGADPCARRLGLLGETQRLQLGHQAGDRAAVESHPDGQLGPRETSGAVHVPQQRAQVVPADVSPDWCRAPARPADPMSTILSQSAAGVTPRPRWPPAAARHR